MPPFILYVWFHIPNNTNGTIKKLNTFVHQTLPKSCFSLNPIASYVENALSMFLTLLPGTERAVNIIGTMRVSRLVGITGSLRLTFHAVQPALSVYIKS